MNLQLWYAVLFLAYSSDIPEFRKPRITRKKTGRDLEERSSGLKDGTCNPERVRVVTCNPDVAVPELLRPLRAKSD